MKSVVIKIRQSIYFALLLSFGTGFFYSCQDKVDESDMYSFTGIQIIDYLNTNDSTTYYAYLTTRVKLSKKSASTVADLLSARGNYTCFAPTNEAVQLFIDSVYNTTGYSIYDVSDSTAAEIVNNSLIDSEQGEAYLTTSFQVGSLERQNFNDRFLTVRFDTIISLT